MDWKDIAGLVGKAAPLLGGILTGPVGAAITVGGMIASALGTDNTPDAVQAAIQSNPEAAIRLAEIEANNRVELEKLAVQAAALKVDEEKAHLADRQDARGRDVKLKQAGLGNIRADVLAYAAIGGLITLMYTLLIVKVPGGPARDVFLLLAGALIVIVKDVYAFEFSSSRGSKDKDALLTKLR